MKVKLKINRKFLNWMIKERTYDLAKVIAMGFCTLVLLPCVIYLVAEKLSIGWASPLIIGTILGIYYWIKIIESYMEVYEWEKSRWKI